MENERWENRIKEVIELHGYDVVELRKESRAHIDIIKIFIDKDDGITVNDCSSVSRLVNDEIFKHDLVSKDYRLEVSSPGVDRPLLNVKDFRRNITRRVRITFHEDDKSIKLEGNLVAADERELEIEKQGNKYSIPMKQIIEGRVVLPW